MAAFSQHRDEYANAPSSTGVQADIDDALKEERLRRASVKDVAPAYMAGSKAWDMFHRTKIMFFCIAR